MTHQPGVYVPLRALFLVVANSADPDETASRGLSVRKLKIMTVLSFVTL